MNAIVQEAPSTPRHPRVLGWVGTTALAMGGSNQMIFLITALFVGQGDIPGQGSAAVPLLIVGLLLELGGGAGLDRARSDVAEPGRRHRGGLRRGVPALQPGALGADRHLLLVGLGADLRADRAPLRLGHPAMVSAGPAGRGRRHRRSCSPSRRSTSAAIKWVARLAIPIATSRRRSPSSRRSSRSLSGTVDWRQATDFTLTTPFDGWFGEPHLGDGRPLPDRLRRAGLRGGDLPCRRNHRSEPQRAARHARQRLDGGGLFHRPARRLAGRARPGAARQGSRRRARPDLRAAPRQLSARRRRSGS